MYCHVQYGIDVVMYAVRAESKAIGVGSYCTPPSTIARSLARSNLPTAPSAGISFYPAGRTFDTPSPPLEPPEKICGAERKAEHFQANLVHVSFPGMILGNTARKYQPQKIFFV